MNSKATSGKTKDLGTASFLGAGKYFLYRVFYWFFIFFPIIVLYLSGIFNTNTPIPKNIVSFVNDASSPLYFTIFFAVNIITSGIACLFPIKIFNTIMRISLEDSGKIFIELSAFWLWLGVMIGVVENNYGILFIASLGTLEFFLLAWGTWFGIEWIKSKHCALVENTLDGAEKGCAQLTREEVSKEQKNSENDDFDNKNQ